MGSGGGRVIVGGIGFIGGCVSLVVVWLVVGSGGKNWGLNF